MLFVLFHDYYILHILTCMDESLKNVYTVSLTYAADHLRNEKQTVYSLTLKFQTCPVQIHPPLNILTVPNWLTI